jgi:hypothetical protein
MERTMPVSKNGEDLSEGRRQGSAFYVDRARESLQLAEREILHAKRVVHLRAAEKWIQFAELARRVEARAAAGANLRRVGSKGSTA